MDKYNTAFQINEDAEEQIDLLELAQALWHKAWILILCAVVGGVSAGIFTKAFITPQYESSSLIYIYTKTTSVTSLADLQIGSQLTVDFQVLATTREVIEKATENLGLDMSYEEMVRKVTISNPNNSRLLKITARDSDPQLASDISNEIATVLRKRIADIMNTDEPSSAEKAVPAKRPSSPSFKKNVMIGAFLMFALASVVIAFVDVFDDTIKTEEDIEKYLHLNVLASVPYVASRSRQDEKTSRRRKIKKDKK